MSKTVMESRGGGAMEQTSYQSSTIGGKNVSISQSGERLITEQQISRTLNTSIGSDKSGALAISGGKPFFSKTLVGRSVERKCRLNLWV